MCKEHSCECGGKTTGNKTCFCMSQHCFSLHTHTHSLTHSPEEGGEGHISDVPVSVDEELAENVDCKHPTQVNTDTV
jgi:hypothetical protein